MILRVIYDVVEGFVVLPNRITVPLTDVDPYVYFELNRIGNQ